MKKGISPVVATALLLVVAVVAVVGFNTWFTTYESKTFSGVEQQGTGSGVPQVDSVIGSSLYIRNPSTSTLNVTSVKIAGKTCANSATVASKGITPVNVSSCVANLTTGLIYDAVIVTNAGTYSKKFYVKSSSSGTTSILSINVSNNGTAIWAKKIALAGSNEIAVDSMGNVYLTGFYSGGPKVLGAVTLPSSVSGSYDGFLVKYNSSGSAQWGRVINASQDDYIYGITIDSSNNIYLVGQYRGSSAFLGNGVTLPTPSAVDGFLVKYDSAGIPQWEKTVNATAVNDRVNSVGIDNSGNVYITGFYSASGATVNLGNGVILLDALGGSDAFLIKYNSAGVTQWGKRIGSSTSDEGTDLAIDSTGNSYVVGYYNVGINFGNGVTLGNAFGGQDSFLLKSDSSGLAQWAKRINSSGLDNADAVQIDSSGNIYVLGEYASGSTTSLGNGVNLPPSVGSSQDIVLLKYNSQGLEQWAKYINSSVTDYGGEMTLDLLGNVYITGTYRNGPIYLGNNIILPLFVGFDDIFFVKYNSNGIPQWRKVINSTGMDGSPSPGSSIGITVDNTGNMYTTGLYNGAVNLGNGVTLAAPFSEFFFVKFK